MRPVALYSEPGPVALLPGPTPWTFLGLALLLMTGSLALFFLIVMKGRSKLRQLLLAQAASPAPSDPNRHLLSLLKTKGAQPLASVAVSPGRRRSGDQGDSPQLRLE